MGRPGPFSHPGSCPCCQHGPGRARGCRAAGAWLQGGLRPRPASSHLRSLSVNWGEGSLLPCPLGLMGGLRSPGSLCVGHVEVPREPGTGLRRRVRGGDRRRPTGPPEGPLSMEVRESP